jgi:hypothetical protein
MAQTVGPELVLDELPHLPPALTDQGEHGDVAGGATRQHAEQPGFADAGSGKQAEALALPTGREAIERAHAEIEPRAEANACRRRGAGVRNGRLCRPFGNGPLPSSARPSGSISRPSH